MISCVAVLMTSLTSSFYSFHLFNGACVCVLVCASFWTGFLCNFYGKMTSFARLRCWRKISHLISTIFKELTVCWPFIEVSQVSHFFYYSIYFYIASHWLPPEMHISMYTRCRDINTPFFIAARAQRVHSAIYEPLLGSLVSYS